MSAKENTPLQQEGYDLMAAAFEVYNTLGFGLSEDLYQEALEIELAGRGIPFLSQTEIPAYYKKQKLNKKFRLDLLAHGRIIVELESCKSLLPEHDAQLFNYLKLTGKPIGYLVNFGAPECLQWKRIITNPL
jgi:GxxExxY protein